MLKTFDKLKGIECVRVLITHSKALTKVCEKEDIQCLLVCQKYVIIALKRVFKRNTRSFYPY